MKSGFIKATGWNIFAFIKNEQDCESDSINDCRFYKAKARIMIKMLFSESYYSKMRIKISNFPSPLTLLDINLRRLTVFRSIRVIRLLSFVVRTEILGDFPEFLTAELEWPVLLRLIPEDLVL